MRVEHAGRVTNPAGTADAWAAKVLRSGLTSTGGCDTMTPMSDTDMRTRVGDKLANGATVLAIGRFDDSGDGSAIVLAFYGTEFVTWAMSTRTLDAYWGHYHKDLRAALDDFDKRVAR